MKLLFLMITIYLFPYGKVIANDFSFILNGNLYFYENITQDYRKINTIDNIFRVLLTNNRVFVITNPIKDEQVSYYLHELIKTKNSDNRDTFKLNFISRVAYPYHVSANENQIVFNLSFYEYVHYDIIKRKMRKFFSKLYLYGLFNNMFVYKDSGDNYYCLDTVNLVVQSLQDGKREWLSMGDKSKGEYFFSYDIPIRYDLSRYSQINIWENNEWIYHEYDCSTWINGIVLKPKSEISNISNDKIISGLTVLEGDLKSNQKNVTMAIVFLELNLKTGDVKQLLRLENPNGFLSCSIIQWKE